MAKQIHSFNDLTNSLTEDLAWRRKELKLIKDYTSVKSSPAQNAALRFSVPILYAHWEGFAKNSCESYLKFVANQYLKHDELKPQFIMLSLHKKLGQIDVNNLEEKTKIISFLIDEYTKKSNIAVKNIIQTKSNLRYTIFKEMIFILNLNEQLFQKYESLIDDLVDARNNIAHGEHLRVEYQTFVNMHNEITELMILLKTDIENSAILKQYKV